MTCKLCLWKPDSIVMPESLKLRATISTNALVWTNGACSECFSRWREENRKPEIEGRKGLSTVHPQRQDPCGVTRYSNQIHLGQKPNTLSHTSIPSQAQRNKWKHRQSAHSALGTPFFHCFPTKVEKVENPEAAHDAETRVPEMAAKPFDMTGANIVLFSCPKCCCLLRVWNLDLCPRRAVYRMRPRRRGPYRGWLACFGG